MLTSFYVIARWAYRISSRFGNFVMANKSRILNWLGNGYTVVEIARALYNWFF